MIDDIVIMIEGVDEALRLDIVEPDAFFAIVSSSPQSTIAVGHEEFAIRGEG